LKLILFYIHYLLQQKTVQPREYNNASAPFDIAAHNEEMNNVHSQLQQMKDEHSMIETEMSRIKQENHKVWNSYELLVGHVKKQNDVITQVSVIHIINFIDTVSK